MQSEYSQKNYSLYKAITTGNTSGLSKKFKDKIQSYGLIHLMTPSGLHLATLVGLFRSFPLIRAIILVLLFIFINHFDGYDSMTRVIIFQLISYKVKKYTFALTIFISIIIGHYQSSALSFTYSFLFWGTILIFKNNPIKMLFFLNYSMYFMNGITGSFASPLSIIVNPSMSFITTLFFPVLVLNNFLPYQLQPSSLINLFFDIWFSIFEYIQRIDLLDSLYFSPFFLIIFLVVLENRSHKWLFIILFTYTSTSPYKKPSSYLPKNLISLNDLGEKKKVRNNKHYYQYGNCIVDDLRFYCKKNAPQ